MTRWLSCRMVDRGIIKEEEQELYQFGIRNGMIILLNILTAFLIGLFTTKLLLVTVFTLSFMVLRSYTGGYHSDSRLCCYIGSNLVLFIPVYTQELFLKIPESILLLGLGLAAGTIFFLSPMHSKNRKLDNKERRYFGRKARIIAGAELVILGILWHEELFSYAYAVYTSICIAAVFMIIGKMQLKYNHIWNEQVPSE